MEIIIVNKILLILCLYSLLNCYGCRIIGYIPIEDYETTEPIIGTILVTNNCQKDILIKPYGGYEEAKINSIPLENGMMDIIVEILHPQSNIPSYGLSGNKSCNLNINKSGHFEDNVAHSKISIILKRMKIKNIVKINDEIRILFK